MIYEIHDLRIKNNRCQVLVQKTSEYGRERKTTYIWRDYIKHYLGTHMDKTYFMKLSSIIFSVEEFPEDEEEIEYE